MDTIPIKIELPAAVNEAFGPLAKGVGNTLASLWDITFGWIDNADQKIKYKRLQSLRAFKDSIESGVSNIPPENLCEPKISIIGPAFEASKYYFEESSLREMFAKLIVNSMNISTKSVVQNSFVEIIKQLSPTDAEIISYFKERSQHAVAKIVAEKKNSPEFLTLHPLLFFYKSRQEENRNETSISLINLQRLGLVEIDFEECFAESSAYSVYEDSPLRKVSPGLFSIANWPRDCCPDNYSVKKGIAKRTSYGSAFIDVCV